MKRKELYNYIREEIINELSTNEGIAVELTGTTGKTVQSFKDMSAANKFKSENPNIKTVKQLEEDNLEEMARPTNKITLGDPEKVELALDVYEGSILEKLINLVKTAGEVGITQDEMAEKLGMKNSSELNPSINTLTKIGAFSKPKKEIQPVKEPKLEPEEEEPEIKDDWEAVEEPEKEKGEEEPKASDIKATEKFIGKGYAKQLSPEDEEKYNKIKAGILAKVEKISKMPKGKQSSSDEMKVLRALIKREDIQKLFKSKGTSLNNLVSDVIGS
jgi:transcriptional regulator with XRE-family HTH domain